MYLCRTRSPVAFFLLHLHVQLLLYSFNYSWVAFAKAVYLTIALNFFFIVLLYYQGYHIDGLLDHNDAIAFCIALFASRFLHLFIFFVAPERLVIDKLSALWLWRCPNEHNKMDCTIFVIIVFRCYLTHDALAITIHRMSTGCCFFFSRLKLFVWVYAFFVVAPAEFDS